MTQKDEHHQNEPEIIVSSESRTKTGLPEDKKKKQAKLFFGVAIIVVALLFLLQGLFNQRASSGGEAVQPKEERATLVDQGNFSPPATPVSPLQTAETDNKNNDNPDNGGLNIGGDAPPVVRISRSGGSMMVSGGKRSDSNKPKGETPDSGLTDAENSSQSDKIGASEDMFGSTPFATARAYVSDLNPHLTLEQGTYIPCVLRTKVISNIAGQLSCIVSENVLSKSGAVVLIERGSKINGVYKKGAVSHGSEQMFVIWQQVRTPNNIIVDVDSGSTDELGANGLSGWTETHFWKRFGNAIMLSMITDVNGALASQLAKNGQRDYLQNTREDSSELAKTVLEQMGDIKPTLYKNQGEKVGVFVARDVDFSKVYQLKRGSRVN